MSKWTDDVSLLVLHLVENKGFSFAKTARVIHEKTGINCTRHAISGLIRRINRDADKSEGA